MTNREVGETQTLFQRAVLRSGMCRPARSRQRGRRGLLSALAVLAVAIAVASGPTAAQDRVGTTAAAYGQVNLARGASRVNLQPADPLFRADVIETAAQSFAQMAFDAGWAFSLAGNASADLVWGPEPNTIYVTLGAVRGVSDGSGQRFRVISGVAIAEAMSTAFYLHVASGDATTLYVEEGRVRFSNRAGATVTVMEGLASTISADGGAPTPPAPPSPTVVQAAIALATTMAAETSPALAVPTNAYQRVRALTETARRLAANTRAQSYGPDAHGK